MNTNVKHLIQSFINKFIDSKKSEETILEDLAEKVPGLFLYSSVYEAMDLLKSYKVAAFPVINFDREVIGIVRESDISHLIAIQSTSAWSGLKNYTLESVYQKCEKTLTLQASLDEIVGEFVDKELVVLPIIDAENKYTDYVVTAASVINYTSRSVKPRTIGGLATPLGVYLTDGYYYSGAGVAGLLLTGIIFSVVLNLITLGSLLLQDQYAFPESALLVFQLVLFIGILRLSPLVGYHAAEHMTIHALEKGLDLNINNVRQQPKEHVRCGTNLMFLMLGLSLIYLISQDFLHYLGMVEHALIIVVLSSLLVFNWKKMGNVLQKYLTTARPTDKQLQSGIDAAKELLDNYNNKTRPVKYTLPRKIWNMGIFQVLISFFVVSVIFQLILSIFIPIKLVCATIMLGTF